MAKVIDVDELMKEFEQWVRDGMKETSTTNDPYESDYDEYDAYQWEMDLYDNDCYGEDWSSDAYKPWIYGN